MIALIVPREEAGAAGGLPHLGLAAGVGWVRSPFVRSALAQQPRRKLIRMESKSYTYSNPKSFVNFLLPPLHKGRVGVG
ncbi:MAG TPA: hypothetical protein DD001_23565 [Microcoleaceae bacterium UBA10368]|jgi:hypothetical protein|nr:hypothetical protein [Microcoleaceae cyanobacterium UBA10368]HCV31696.1 hypothetical protein [Microcoleaceae cyanobacterium UBA9251]